MSRRDGFFFGASLVALGLGLSTAAIAQTAPATAPQAADASDGGIADIVVTAQRRSERLQDVPISITAVTAQAVQAAGVITTESIATVVPGLVMTRANEVPQFYLRGVGTQNTSPGEEGSVGVYVDGVLMSSLPSAVFGLANIERIEVLKGPQGTLFGRNATGGLIHVITRTPSFTPGAEGSVGYGNFETLDAKFYGTVPLANTVAADLAVAYHDQNKGFGKNIFNGQDIYRSKELSLRSKFLWNIGDDTSFTLANDYNKVTSSFGNGRTVLPGVIGSAGSVYTGNFYNINNNLQPLSHTRQFGTSGKFEHDLGFARIVNLAAYRNVKTHSLFDVEGSPVRVIDFDLTAKIKQFTEEFQLQSQPDSPIQWIGGVYFLKAQTRITPAIIRGPGGGATGLSITNSRMETTSLAGFGQATAPLGEHTKLTVGLRYTSDKREFYGTRALAVPPAAPVAVVDDDRNFKKLTYRVALDHKVTDDILVYASYSRGFKSGLFNMSNIVNPPVRPETLDAAEVGVKSDLFDRRVRLNLSAYRYWYKDVQLTQLVGGFSFLVNAAKAKVFGLDGELVVEPVKNLTFNVGGSALFDANYVSFPGAPFSANNGVLRDSAGTIISPTQVAFPGGVICPRQAVVPVGGNRGGCSFDASGNRMIRAPKLTYNVGVNYAIPTDMGKFGFAANWSHNSGYFFEPDNRLHQPSYGLLSSQISWRTESDMFGVRLWASNLLDKKYYQLNSSSAADVYNAAPPRTYGVAVDVKF